LKHDPFPVSERQRRSAWRTLITGALITLIGFNLRSVILAVPPVLPLLQRDLGLSHAEAGMLTAMPALVLGLAAWSSGLLIERIGERNCVALGLLLLGGGALLRALWPAAWSLFLFTLLLCIGIVLAQTAVPVLARRWFPERIGLVAALFSDGLIIGEAVAAGLTLPLMARFLGGDNWRGTFLLWGGPVLILLLLWLWLAPQANLQGTRSEERQPGSAQAAPFSAPAVEMPAEPAGERPAPEVQGASAARRVNALHLGIMLGGGSLIYFGMNSWIASYDEALHRQMLTSLLLGVLNTAQLPSSLAITLFAQQLAGRRWPFVGAGAVCALAVGGWVISPASLEVLWAAVLGAASALVFTLGIALPPLLAAPHEVARLTGITLSLTYAVAFVGPFIGGALWDWFGLPALAFLPVLVAGLLLVVLGAFLPERRAFGVLKGSVSLPQGRQASSSTLGDC
jgi:CP family cyanate transporter-like MFS transporter